MRLLGGCAVLVGGLELLNSVVAGAAVIHVGGSALAVAACGVVGVASVLLLASGVALVVRPRRSVAFARGSALVALVVFALAALRPAFSIASMLLGVAFPIVMLLGVGRGSPARAASAP